MLHEFYNGIKCLTYYIPSCRSRRHTDARPIEDWTSRPLLLILFVRVLRRGRWRFLGSSITLLFLAFRHGNEAGHRLMKPAEEGKHTDGVEDDRVRGVPLPEKFCIPESNLASRCAGGRGVWGAAYIGPDHRSTDLNCGALMHEIADLDLNDWRGFCRSWSGRGSRG